MDTVTNKLKQWRRLGSFANTTGRQTLNFDVGSPLTCLLLHCQYIYTPDAVSDAVGALFQQNARFLKRVEVIVGGKDTVVNVQPSYYAARRLYENQGLPMKGMETAIDGVHGHAATVVDLYIPIHFDLVNGRRRDDAALDLRGINLAQLAVTFGDTLTSADLWTTPHGVISDISLNVEGEFIVNAKSPVAGFVAKYPGQRNGDSYVTRVLDELTFPITGTSNNYQQIIDGRSGWLLRTLPLVFTTNDLGDEALCPIPGGLIKLDAGARNFFATEPGFVKARHRDELRIPAANEIVGVDFIDLQYAGSLASCIPTGKLDADLKLTAQVVFAAGNSQINILREYTRPLQLQ